VSGLADPDDGLIGFDIQDLFLSNLLNRSGSIQNNVGIVFHFSIVGEEF
jgi:hypothetical protein